MSAILTVVPTIQFQAIVFHMPAYHWPRVVTTIGTLLKTTVMGDFTQILAPECLFGSSMTAAFAAKVGSKLAVFALYGAVLLMLAKCAGTNTSQRATNAVVTAYTLFLGLISKASFSSIAAKQLGTVTDASACQALGASAHASSCTKWRLRVLPSISGSSDCYNSLAIALAMYYVIFSIVASCCGCICCNGRKYCMRTRGFWPLFWLSTALLFPFAYVLVRASTDSEVDSAGTFTDLLTFGVILITIFLV